MDSLVSPLEIHFVHTTNGGTSTAVLAVRFRERNRGEEGEVEWLDQIMAVKNLKKQQSEWADQVDSNSTTTAAPAVKSSAPAFSVDDIPTISIKSILPKHFDYLEYSGSLTTPPCTENVHWYLLTAYADIEYSQIRRLTLVRHSLNEKKKDFESIQAVPGGSWGRRIWTGPLERWSLDVFTFLSHMLTSASLVGGTE